MKTKVIFAIFMALLFVSVSNAQTRQQRQALKMVAEEKTALERELAELENSIATYVAIDTVPVFSRKKEIDLVLASGEMSVAQQAAYKKQSQKLGQKLEEMRQKLLVANASSRRIEEIELRLQDLNDYQTRIVNGQLDEAVNQEIPQEMTRLEAKRRHRSNAVESEEIQIQRQYLGIKKLASTPVKATEEGYLGMVTWNVSPGKDTSQVITFIIYDKGKTVP